MLRYVFGRVGQAILVMVVAYIAAFFLLYGVGGNPLVGMYSGGDSGKIDAAQLAQLEHQYGFDRPLIAQFFSHFGAALTGNFGVSLKNDEPVTATILQALPQTFELVGLALVIAIALGGIIAVAATGTSRNWLRQTLLSLPSFGVSMPTFWVGLILVEVFAFQLRVLPPLGNQGFRSLVLPAITLALPGAAQIAQLLAKSLFTAQGEAYIVTARAIGLGPGVIHLRDTLRNALIPSLTMAGIMVANMFGGTLVVESVFSRVGLGQIAVQAVLSHDIPLVLGVVVLGAMIFALVTLIVDLLYLAVDPRLRPVRRTA